MIDDPQNMSVLKEIFRPSDENQKPIQLMSDLVENCLNNNKSNFFNTII